MQNAQDVLLHTAEELIQQNQLEDAIAFLLRLDQQTSAGIRHDIIMQSGNFNQVLQMFNSGVLDDARYFQMTARTRAGLLAIVKGIPKKLELNAKINSLGAYQFSVPDDARLEKIIGPGNNLLKIRWLEDALKASKAVCRVVCANGELGTGFMTKEGYVFTNNHVLKSADVAKTARLEFNYEIGADGKAKSRTTYQLDASNYKTSPPNEFDFARVKVIDRADAPLGQWGFVEFDPDAIPSVGESVTIIQHPKGEDKQIALNANEVLGQLNQHIFYTTDTEPGSSGSPVFNKDWKVVAIHHAGKTDAEGGMVINAQGEKRGANRGILFRDIFAFIGK
ncbi:MAG TPA: trypsin-like peptidase domain-containing protein [Saprospiraceae bacterium]|nr:trypsin-like peptidase domain-containing protein [Saprospiraceae bacterium]